MKTVSELKAEYEATRQHQEAEQRKLFEAYLEKLPPLSTIVTSDCLRSAGAIRMGLKEEPLRYRLVSMACDHCHTELVSDIHELRMLQANPKSREALLCPGCGVTFYLPLEVERPSLGTRGHTRIEPTPIESVDDLDPEMVG